MCFPQTWVRILLYSPAASSQARTLPFQGLPFLTCSMRLKLALSCAGESTPCVSRWRTIDAHKHHVSFSQLHITLFPPPIVFNLTAAQPLKVPFPSGTKDQCTPGVSGERAGDAGGGSGWYHVPSFFAERLVSFKLDLAVSLHTANSPSFLSVNSLCSAPGKPALKAEAVPCSWCSPEARQLPRPAQTQRPPEGRPRLTNGAWS